jgi:hypothetical protein
MQLEQGYHLTYCTNIHPGESWEEVFISLENYLPGLKQKLSPDKPFGVGLRLSDRASRELLEGTRLSDFLYWLQSNGLYVFTMNGFPFGGFHHQVVKDAVHKPDWTTVDRLEYTKRLANILAVLLPEGMEGGISTSPLSYKPWFGNNKVKLQGAFRTSSVHLAKLVEELVQIKMQTGKTIHIDLEPEPDGFLENTDEVIEFYKDWLIPVGCYTLQEEAAMSFDAAQKAIFEHIQLCYDVCHFALAYEEPAEAFARLKSHGVKIGKIQISAALKAFLPDSIDGRNVVAEKLAPFVESTYLHQVVERDSNSKLTHYTDLSLALEYIQKPEAREWRTHFHVPLFTHEYNGLLSTQDDIKKVLDILKVEPVSRHLEVETYTWDVLPAGLKKELSESIQRELEWVIENLR